MKIDYIVHYLDPTKSEWMDLYYKYSKENHLSKIEKINRFDFNPLFKFQFRGIEKYMPWINKIHLIVQSEDQIPDWINRNNVNVVFHKDFIPQEYLPTFNSCTIECFLHKIPELEEHFLYSNDDCYIFKNCDIKDFFTEDGYPRNMYRIARNSGDLYTKYNHFMNDILIKDFPEYKLENIKRFYVPEHCITVFNKSYYQEAFEKYKNIILNNIYRFRSKRNISQYFFNLYFIFKTKSKYTRKEYGSLYRMWDNSGWEIISKMQRISHIKIICLNNKSKFTALILEIMKKYLPFKSKYEI